MNKVKLKTSTDKSGFYANGKLFVKSLSGYEQIPCNKEDLEEVYFVVGDEVMTPDGQGVVTGHYPDGYYVKTKKEAEYVAEQLQLIEKFGIFGNAQILRSYDGYIETRCLVQESGCFAGMAPEELRIREIIPPAVTDEDVETMLQEINAKRDLPLYIRKVRLKIC